ncbi:MAG: type IV secretory system conjugative DNA transfer family protein [Caulobacteraceae bacterium]
MNIRTRLAVGAGVLAGSVLLAMMAMTYHRAGHVGLYWPWAWFVWAKLYGHAHRWVYLGDMAFGAGVFLTPLVCLVVWFRLSRPAVSNSAFGAASWANLDDVKKAKLVPEAGDYTGRVFGKMGGRLLVYKGNEPALVVGATRSGKGAGHVVPTLLTWPESALIYDRKGELWEITVDRRKTFSHCLKFDPTDKHTVRWNPLFEVRKGPMEIADIQNVVGILVDPLGLKAGDLNFWDQSAASFFTALILHILYTADDGRKNLGEVRRQLINLEPTLHAMLNTAHRYKPDLFAEDGLARDEHGEPIPEPHPEIILGAQSLALMDDRVKANVLATMQASVQLWADPNVDHATSTSDFIIGDLVCSPHPVSFYLQTPQAHADRLAFLVRVFLRQTINSMMESLPTDGRGRPKRHKMLLLLDEFPKLGALPFLENAMGEMTGYGITPHLICQSFNDVFAKYGDRTAMFDNMFITACVATSEPESIRKVIQRAGKAREMRESYSDPRGWTFKGNRTVSRSEQQQYILSEEDVRGLPNDQQFLFVNNTKPIRAGKVQYWTEPVLKGHAGGFFHGELARYQQRAGHFDLPGRPTIDWLGVRPVQAPPPMPAAQTTARRAAFKQTVATASAGVGHASDAGLPTASDLAEGALPDVSPRDVDAIISELLLD